MCFGFKEHCIFRSVYSYTLFPSYMYFFFFNFLHVVSQMYSVRIKRDPSKKAPFALESGAWDRQKIDSFNITVSAQP